MNTATRTWALAIGIVILQLSGSAMAQDWPQFRGGNRDGKVTGFTAPATWPKEFAQKWKTSVGDGVATPALVGDKIYVFSRQGENEVTACLDAANGKEFWSDKYPALGVNGPASGYSGPRSCPAVADGKVVTLGVHGVLSCLDAATGKVLWRKSDLRGEPRFSVASSPIVVDGACIAQAGGGIVAYDLAGGSEKWKWTGDAPAYASPVLMTIDKTPYIVAETESKIVALGAADGKLAWEAPFVAQGMGAYNAATPIVDGDTVIYSGGGRGTRAVKLEKQGDSLAGKELWSNGDKSVQFCSPVVKDGLVYGLTQGNELFCLDEKTGKTAWSAAVGPAGQPGPGPGGPGGGPGGGRPGGRGMRGGGGRGGFGSIVDAGSVLMALTPKGELVIFQPGDKAFTEVARIKVANSGTYAYPILSGNKLYIKDQDSVAMLAVE